ncbi:hypothetical protein TESG_08047 [Trichophyton tonsurans CBS 112818]|uniref:Uncharacterized protein n=1 Tax=Trichophyton tonsurans (strain CBS 112818) TaxID=647933 RepID=F2SB04_TRIT1|nr:hypothetical protein TESG_08047 [Trichophyton tonsurans CBS 112818]
MLRWYQAKLAARPLLTQSVGSAVLFGTGDVLAQQLVDRVGIEKHDFARTGRMVLYGGGIPLRATCKPYNARSKKLMVTRALKI